MVRHSGNSESLLASSAASPLVRPVRRGPGAKASAGPQRSADVDMRASAELEEPCCPSFVDDAVDQGLRSPGEPLDAELREFMETSFGQDFSGVRVHTTGDAAESSSAIDANAYTLGEDMVFAAGKYSPDTSEGQKLIAHELTHVVQQANGAAVSSDADEGLSLSEPGDESEQFAETVAGEVMNSDKPSRDISAAGPESGGSVQRDEDEGWLSRIGGAISDAGSAVASGVGSAIDTGENLVSDAGSAISSGVGAVVDAGSSLVSDAGSAISSTAEAVAGGVSDVAGDVWKGAKAVGSGVADVGSGIYSGMKGLSSEIKKGEGWVDKGVDWVDDEAKSGTHWLASQADGVPVLGSLAKGAESAVDFSIDETAGFAKGATGIVGGLASAVADPVDTAKGLYTMSEHIPGLGLPQKLLHGAYDYATTDKSLSEVADETLNPMSDAKYWGGVGKALWKPFGQSIAAGKPGEAVGRAGADLASFLTGTGEASVAAEAADVADVATAAKVADAADAADVAQTADVADVATTADTATTADVADTADTAQEANPVSEATPESEPQEATTDANAEADAVQRGRNARLRQQSPYRADRLEKLKQEMGVTPGSEATAFPAEDTKLLMQDRGVDVPQEIAEGETSLGEARVNVHHKNALNEAPELASHPENMELLDAQGGGSAHAAGAHGGDYRAARAGEPANPAFDENLGFSADKRRLLDSATGKPVAGLGQPSTAGLSVEEEGALTAMPKDTDVESLLEGQGLANWPSQEDALIELIDRSRW